MIAGVAHAFSDDIAIDLGTANTLVHVVGRGIIIDEPSVVAVQVRGGQRVVLAVGLRAKAMLGKTPEPVEIIRPMRDGVIADFIATEQMLRQFISRAKSILGFRRPRILICVPAGATPVERRAVYETAVTAGARKVYLIEEPVAASLGAGLPIDGPQAFMVVDIGGGTTDIAVLSNGEVVQARSMRVAGNAMDEAIMRYVRRRHGLVIGESNAERIKIEAGTALLQPNGRQIEIHIKGRDLLLAASCLGERRAGSVPQAVKVKVRKSCSIKCHAEVLAESCLINCPTVGIDNKEECIDGSPRHAAARVARVAATVVEGTPETL